MNNNQNPPKRRQSRMVSKLFFESACAFLKNNKDLWFLPLISFVVLMVLFASMATGFIYDLATNYFSPVALGCIVAVCYLLLSFVAIFMQAWLVACVYDRLLNVPCSLSQGFMKTLRRTGAIFLWSIFSATVGLILSILENLHDLIADIIAFIFGVAWACAIYFVVPVLVVQGVGPISALKQSSRVFGRNWYKVIRFSFFYSFLIFAIVACLLFLGFSHPHLLEQYMLIWLPAVIVFFIAASLFARLFNAIVQSALYIHYIENKTPTAFSNDLLEQAFAKKRMRFFGNNAS